MASADRQSGLLAEDWKRVYQSFRNADFQSYDFDSLRRTMINYLRENYPEDFNDYVESSEYLALIDLIAFLGQNIAFRVDLNARENFIELAERRESVLRLARTLSYNPKRNIAASGLLKFDSVSTTEDLVDSNGFNLAGQTILWNDPSNLDWKEQFTSILNAALPVNGTIGRPVKKDTVAGVATQQYRFNSLNTDVPVYSYSKSIEGTSLPFEVTSTDVDNGEILEEIPARGNSFACIYRDDGRGPASSNTGFFSMFKQGTLEQGEFTVSLPTSNQIVDVDAQNINQTDVWLYSLGSNSQEAAYWTKVDAIEGNNIVYNSLSNSVRDIYSVLTRADDRVGLAFGDGVFGNLPQGQFRVYYRTSANRNLIIKPADMLNISVEIPYLSRQNTPETLKILMSLKYTVDNSSPSESTDSIRQRAPAMFYTQNRMVTGEDYNIVPLSVSQEIVKAKSVNRTVSGISRYYDLIDSTGKYSKTNIFADDGVIYKEKLEQTAEFTFATQTDVEGAIENVIAPIIRSRGILQSYLTEYPILQVAGLNLQWRQVSTAAGAATGFLTNDTGTHTRVGSFVSGSLSAIESGAMCKFVAPAGYHFNSNSQLVAGPAVLAGDTTYKWTKIVSVVGDGTESADATTGAITISDPISDPVTVGEDTIYPRLVEIREAFSNTLTSDLKSQIVSQAFAYNTFALRYSTETHRWELVTATNIDTVQGFSLSNAGSTTGKQLDASWLVLCETDGNKYTVTYRTVRYIFESAADVRFYYDAADRFYDATTGQLVKDKISVLSINTVNGGSTVAYKTDFPWEIISEYRSADGFIDSTKIEIGFFDGDSDGVVDNPDAFSDLVLTNADGDAITDIQQLYIFQERYYTGSGAEDFRYATAQSIGAIVVGSQADIAAYSAYADSTLFYIVDIDTFKRLDKLQNRLVITTDYRAFVGRDQLKFQYIHSANSNSRIDPSSSNIIDTYLLTKSYDVQYRLWLTSALDAMPVPPTSDALFRAYGNAINKIKSISDEVIYHPVKYKLLFGTAARPELQATFKVVKNPNRIVTDNDIKSRVIQAIDQYFVLDNWDFGETFYFSELSTFVMNQLSPDIVTIVIVPVLADLTFGSLYEIKAEPAEIFISGASVDNVEIIDAVTASKLRAAGSIVVNAQ